MMKLSIDQDIALRQLKKWWSKKERPVTLGGFAGTGKTTLISYFKKELESSKENPKVAFVSYTGKASRILKNKLKENGSLKGKDFVGTIHSLIYSPLVNLSEEIIGWERKPELEYDLIIIDEASMVDERIWKDLLSFNIPILAVGDHGQLPPIHGKFNLMENPTIKIEKIHRQAEDNPIIKLASIARESGNIPFGTFSEGVKKLDRTLPESVEEINDLLMFFSDDLMILSGYNNTRIKLNKTIRNNLGFETDSPLVGDRVICLRNNHEKEIYNGMLGEITYIEESGMDWYFSEVRMFDDNLLYKGEISAKQFNNSEGALNFGKNRKEIMKGDLFDFGYALTVHKAQGSQSPKVLLFEERFRQMDEDMWRRWLYTAVTRAETQLVIIG